MTEPLSIERLALRLQLLPRVGAASLRRVVAGILVRKMSPDEFVSLDRDTLMTAFHLSSDAIVALKKPTPPEADLWTELAESDIKLLVHGTPHYPSRLGFLLGETAPPLLFVKGNPASLEASGVGFCGSRKASEKGLAVARECARLLANDRLNIVSGYAHGVDLAAHHGALEAGGTTTLVLAEGILKFRVKEELRDYLSGPSQNGVTVVSEFPPGLPWKAHNAMIRNRTICGLSDVLVVIESGLEGGTFEAGKTALTLKQPLFCVEYSNPAESAAGNAWLVEHGAERLRRSKSGVPNLSHLLQAVHSRRPRPSSIEQSSLPIEPPASTARSN